MSRWVIVLAGGEGTRIRPMIRKWLGIAVPKQYCAFCGTRSMLEHTLDRAARLVDADKIITVIGKGHRRFHFTGSDQGYLIEQPESRDTAPGVFLPAAYVRAVDPSATLYILPSDQFVFPEDRLTPFLTAGARYADSLGKIVLMGARPDRAETDYGWIEPGNRLSAADQASLCEVVRFREKPAIRDASDWLRRGHLWNTMMLAAPLEKLWSLGYQLLPRMMTGFDSLVNVFGKDRTNPEQIDRFLNSLYSEMSSANFSRDLLERARHDVAVLELEGLYWCDWGRAERIVETLHRIGRSAAFEVSVPQALSGDSH